MLSIEQAGVLLGAWQGQEVRLAKSYRECSGLTTEHLKDLYQDAAVDLLEDQFDSEGHLRSVLRLAIKRRALNVHRDERTRRGILAQNAPGIYALEQARAAEHSPAQRVQELEDGAVINEFLAELTPFERRVFRLASESGRSSGYHRIALRLGKPVPTIRKALYAIEPKRERFVRLYSTGRLCGYRAATITALKDGQGTSEELAQRAITHVEGCARCRAEHQITAKRLQRAFQQQTAAAIVPLAGLPAGWLRTRHAAKTLKTRVLAASRGRVLHGRLAALYGAEGGAAGKLARAATVVFIAGGALHATHALTHPSHHQAAGSAPVSTLTLEPIHLAIARGTREVPVPPKRPQVRRAPGHLVRPRIRPQYEPGGFAYLGVPTKAPAPTKQPHQPQNDQRGGGPFSP